MAPRRIIAAALSAWAALFLNGAAAAQPESGHQDRIVLQLAAEGWVETETAEVVVAVNATLEQDQAAAVRETILKTLGKLADDAEWRITTFNRRAEQSGLDSWHVEAQARIADTGLDGLRRAADAASRPGLKITVANINFTPTLAEVEATRARLRGDLYRQAKAELARVKAAFPSREYRIGLIDFTGMARPAPRQDDRVQARAARAESAGNIAVQDRLRLRARVVLTTSVPDTE